MQREEKLKILVEVDSIFYTKSCDHFLQKKLFVRHIFIAICIQYFTVMILPQFILDYHQKSNNEYYHDGKIEKLAQNNLNVKEYSIICYRHRVIEAV